MSRSSNSGCICRQSAAPGGPSPYQRITRPTTLLFQITESALRQIGTGDMHHAMIRRHTGGAAFAKTKKSGSGEESALIIAYLPFKLVQRSLNAVAEANFFPRIKPAAFAWPVHLAENSARMAATFSELHPLARVRQLSMCTHRRGRSHPPDRRQQLLFCGISGRLNASMTGIHSDTSTFARKNSIAGMR